MRPRIEPSNDLAPLSPFRSWLDCTTNTSGYDFRKGQGPWILVDANAMLYSVALLAIELAEIGGSLWHVESAPLLSALFVFCS
jgi:hypothetical protein